MGKPKESLEEKRARIYEEILEESNKPRYRGESLASVVTSLNLKIFIRFGYFGYTAPLCIGENSAYKTTRRKRERIPYRINHDYHFSARSEEDPPDLGRNLMTNPSKKGTGVDALFSFP